MNIACPSQTELLWSVHQSVVCDNDLRFLVYMLEQEVKKPQKKLCGDERPVNSTNSAEQRANDEQLISEAMAAWHWLTSGNKIRERYRVCHLLLRSTTQARC